MLSFGPFADHSIGLAPVAGRAAADFNGDSRFDAVTSGFNGLGILLGNGDGTCSDYQAASGTLTIPAGQTSGTTWHPPEGGSSLATLTRDTLRPFRLLILRE